MRQTELILQEMGQDLQKSAHALVDLAEQWKQQGNPNLMEVLKDAIEVNGCTDFANLLRIEIEAVERRGGK